MADLRAPEFTGERVIPGLVDDNLLNEHLARYRFAARFVKGANVLDAGCGSGYGTAEFGQAAFVTAVDISTDAIAHAARTFSRPGVRFLQASCTSLPFAAASFDLVAAFEVIEHLEQWENLLNETKRVLKPTGVLLVSTPNKSYYAESRAVAGPNPFHCHEFEYAEFEAALYAVFPHVRMWSQNHSEALVFAPLHPSGGALEASGDATPETAHFFVAACSQSAIAANEVYAWMPSSANLLREREHHIAKLSGECAKKDAWLNELMADHAGLQQSHEALLAELEQRNEWAAGLNREVAERRAAIARLQAEAAANLTWVRDLESRISQGDAEIVRLNHDAVKLEADVAARTAWAQTLETQLAERTLHVQIQSGQIADLTTHLEHYVRALDALRGEQALIANSKWIRLGRRLRLGPLVDFPRVGE